MALNQAGNQAVYETTKRHLLRALQSPAQLREQMTWFWMNHFSVFSGKANVRWTLAEYEETVRAQALGKFSDLVMATALSPAMLEYLDNAQSAAGKINENYARELMELHTLGVSGGPSGSSYTQQDVQELARVLTGAGLNLTDNTPRLGANRQALYVRKGLFEFNPARHDFGDKTLLGHTISGKGLSEIDEAVTLLCRQPATAKFISRKLATYFVADDPPPALVDRMTRTFQKTDGSIAAVLRSMFLDRDLAAALNAEPAKLEKFKDPTQFVLSSLRLAYEGKVISNYRPVLGWLAAAWRADVRPRHAGWLRAHGGGVDELRTDRSTFRDRSRDRQRQRRPLQRRGHAQHAGTGHGLPDAELAAVLRCHRAVTERTRARRARPHVVAAGMEHGPAVVARLDAAVAPEV